MYVVVYFHKKLTCRSVGFDVALKFHRGLGHDGHVPRRADRLSAEPTPYIVRPLRNSSSISRIRCSIREELYLRCGAVLSTGAHDDDACSMGSGWPLPVPSLMLGDDKFLEVIYSDDQTTALCLYTIFPGEENTEISGGEREEKQQATSISVTAHSSAVFPFCTVKPCSNVLRHRHERNP